MYSRCRLGGLTGRRFSFPSNEGYSRPERQEPESWALALLFGHPAKRPLENHPFGAGANGRTELNRWEIIFAGVPLIMSDPHQGEGSEGLVKGPTAPPSLLDRVELFNFQPNDRQTNGHLFVSS